MQIHPEDTAVVFIDPQNDVLSEKGLSWPLVRESLQESRKPTKAYATARSHQMIWWKPTS